MADFIAILGYYIYYKHLELRRKAFSDRCELLTWQNKQAEKQLRYAASYSPFYRGKRRLKDCPVIDKSVMMSHFDQINTVGIKCFITN